MLNKSCIPQIQCTWHSYLISICGYANVRRLSNLINLLLRQSENMNQSWATSAPRAKGMRGCGKNTVSCSKDSSSTWETAKSKSQKKKKKKKKLPRHNNQDIPCTTQDKPGLIQGLNKISAARQFLNCPSCRLILWFTGGWQGAGRRATLFPDCSIVKSFFSLPTLKALNNVYKMLGNPGRFPI